MNNKIYGAKNRESWYNKSEDNARSSLELSRGCVNIWIDEIVPCLVCKETGELLDTVVFKIESRSYLNNFTEANGWNINWNAIPQDVSVYALALQNDNKIQGLIGLKNDIKSNAVYIHWACVAPQNNKYQFGKQMYYGVGGHLFAIAVEQSINWGHEGVVHGFAADKELLEHYINVFDGTYLGLLHQFQFVIDEIAAGKILEVYTYEWKENGFLER